MLKNILYGLIPAQVIAFFHVYFSNLKLFKFLTVADRAGYLIVPGHDTLPSLQSPLTAFWGGLFFTLTVGASLSILSYGLCRMWLYLFKRNRTILVLLLILWLFILLLFNIKGVAFFPSLYLVIIPLIVFLTTLRSLSRRRGKGKQLSAIIHLLPVLLLAVLWTTEYDKQIFPDIRDNLLLSNKLGQEINNFYYKYTLYPAEAFKTLEQKQLKGCTIKRVNTVNKKSITVRLEDELLNHDYLILETPWEMDLGLQIKERSLNLNKSGALVYRVPIIAFFRSPGTVLKTYSRKTDTNGLFRSLAFFSLLVGVPLLLYLITYSASAKAIGFFVQPEWSGWIASFLCLVLGLVILSLFQAGRSYDLSANDIGKALGHAEWQQRTAALKLIEEKNLEIGEFNSYKALLASSHIAERYWLARALGRSRRHSTLKDLMSLVNDPHPNVACMALEALGTRRDKRSIPLILKKINSSKHWYVEWYAYRALRALGWKQKRST